MHSNHFAVGIVLGIVCMSIGCTWVPITPAGESVEVVAQTSTASSVPFGCERKGVVNAQTRTRVGFLARSRDTITRELQSLARNDAAELGANRIVAEGPPSLDGRQRFTAYLCR